MIVPLTLVEDLEQGAGKGQALVIVAEGRTVPGAYLVRITYLKMLGQDQLHTVLPKVCCMSVSFIGSERGDSECERTARGASGSAGDGLADVSSGQNESHRPTYDTLLVEVEVLGVRVKRHVDKLIKDRKER
jgi:hypothetical protein